MKLISGHHREDVWLDAVKYLLNAEDQLEYNLILEVKAPSSSSAKSKAIRNKFDKLLEDAKLYPVETVAETIFPLHEYKKYKIDGVLNQYPDNVYPKIQPINANNRGTYAYRIVRGYDQKGNKCNPLEKVIRRLKNELPQKGGKRFAYELSIDSCTDDTIPINRNDACLMGFPCLSHLSFKLSRKRDSLHLTALYRSQYYTKKALGNLLGLARLQACVAKELGINVGTLVCHATMANLDLPKNLGKTKIKALIKDIEETYNDSNGISATCN